ncbi:type II toxin-antitoxin system HicB family antitoxin [Desulfovibrio desulfuricans]|uniref:type II toxin-antitoxin system HicB family antitoxin n=1 Tax=Desulfovibrio desulfuricans TaxID=876 RepID=UPI00177B3024|nr:type II toxin-antitoxin system HicB family antitoxin [Desulfovibrio desulfuricans]MBD8894768.1 type II toxin-antitoxin system HicB family antitoxin [Desulfovibrio desulfuricans]
MKNVMDFDGYKAAIAYDPEMEMFRGEFVGLNGGADFYASDLAGLRREGSESLRIFLEECAKHSIEPRKPNRGNFALRLEPDVYHRASVAAAAQGKSLNAFIADTVKQAVG